MSESEEPTDFEAIASNDPISVGLDNQLSSTEAKEVETRTIKPANRSVF